MFTRERLQSENDARKQIHRVDRSRRVERVINLLLRVCVDVVIGRRLREVPILRRGAFEPVAEENRGVEW